MDYPKRLRFTSQYRNYKIFFVSPTRKEINGQLIHVPGKQLEFENNACVCEDPETIKLALEDGYYGKDYTSPEWEKMKMEQKENEQKQAENSVPVQEKPRVGRPAGKNR